MKNTKLYPALNILFFILCLFVNFKSVTGGLGGKSIRELSDKYSNLFTPSNQTFAIWSLIYLLLGLTLSIQFSEKWKSKVMNTPFFIISCLLNGGWIVAWQLEYIFLSLFIMAGLLLTLVHINKNISDEKLRLIKLTFGIYLGWICIATIANATALLQSCSINLSLAYQQGITLAILLTGTSIVVGVMHKLNNPFLSLAAAWAFYGIYTRQIENFPSIAYVSILCAILIILVAVKLTNSLVKNQ